MHVDPNSIGGLGNDKRIQSTFKGALGINTARIVTPIEKFTKMLPASLNGIDIPLAVQNITRGYQFGQACLITLP